MVYTRDMIVDKLKVEIADAGGQVKLAEKWKTHQSAISYALNGKREIPPKILEKLGVIPVTIYSTDKK